MRFDDERLAGLEVADESAAAVRFAADHDGKVARFKGVFIRFFRFVAQKRLRAVPYAPDFNE